MEAQTLTVTQAQGAELTLPYGTYTLTESGTLHTTDYLWQSVGFTGGEQGAADGRSYTFDFHPAQGGSITVTAENRYAIRTDGVLTVTKTVTTEAGVNAPDQSFAFTVKLGEGTERQTVSGRTAAYAENGLYEVQLKHGQQFTVTGIPRNTAYEVTEAPDASYVTRADQAAGTIENGSTAVTAAFTNAYITQDVTFSKLETGTSNAVSGARFRLVQNGEQAASAVSTENGTVTFADVPCGVYTLEEVGHVPGYEALNRTGVTVTVTADGVAYDTGRSNEHASLENGILKVCNTHKTADITVTKTVTGYSGDEVYTFGLYTKTGNGYAPAADSISVKAGETAAFADLRTGVTYYVQETGAARTGYDLETSWTGGTVNEDGYVPVSLPLDKTEAAALECTNAYTRHTGSLTIHKALSGLTETAQLPQELAYAFTASNDEAGKTGTITYTEAGDNSVTITGLPTGSYTVTEEEPAVAIPAYTWDGVTFSADSVEITKGQTAEITATNHYSKTGGWDTAAALTITKAVTGVRSDAEQGKTYSFAIDGTDIYGGDFHRTATVTMGQDQNKTTLQVPYGTYTVSETAQAPIEGYTFTGVTYAESAEVTLSSTAKTAAVTVTNAYTRDLGTLTVEKILSAEDYETINALPDHPSFHFTAELDGEQTLTTEIGWEQLKKSGDTYTAKAVWEDVPTGAWTVAEDTARAAQDRFTLTVNGQPAAANGHLNEAYGKLPVTVVKGTDADVLFTNDYAPVYRDIERGSFEIYKYENVEGVGQPLAGVTFELYHGDEKLNSYTTGADGRVTVTLDSYLDADGSPMSFRLEEQVPAGYEKNEDANWAWEITATRAADGKVDLRASQSMDGMWDRFFDWISSIVDNDRAAFLEHGQLSIRNERIYDEPVVQDVTGGNSFSILKQDDVTEAQLHGAEFTVYGQTAAGETIPVGRSTAQSDGLRVVITGTELAKVAGAVGAHTGDTLHLTMQETKAPAGYTPDSTVWELTLTCTRTESKDPAGSFLYTYQWAVTDVTGSYAEGKLTVPNTAIDYTVRVLKQNEKGQALSGAAFTLNGAAMTAVNGHTFETTGVHYDANAPQLTIAETAAPDGYQSVGSFGLRFVAEDGVITGLEKTETTPASVTVSNEGRVFTVIVQDARMENHQTAGSITIDKTVTGDNIHAAGQTYTFTVEGESIYGENISKPVSVTVGEDNTGSAEVKVPYGTYTVTEITPAADGIEGYTFRDVTVTEERVTLSGSHTADTFHVTNHYDRMSGSEEAGTLTITKTVKGENGVTIKGQGLSFSFTVEGESIYGEKISRIVNVTVGEDNTGSAEVKVPYGTYTVTETGIPAIEGYKAPAVSVIPDAVTVSKANAAIAIEAVNIYGKMENWDAASKLTIHKTVTGGNIHAADQTYAFTVEGESIYGENISKPVSVTVGEDNTGSVTVELPYGTYTVTEQNADRTGYRWTVTGSGTQAQLTPEEPAAAVTITNDYQKDYGEDPEIVVPGVDPDPEDPKEPPVEDPEKIHEYIRDGLSFTIHKVRRGSDHIMSDVEFTLTGKNAAGEDIQLFRGRTDDKARLAITVPAELLAQVAGAAAEEPGVLTLTLTETRPAGYQQAGPWTVTLEAERSEELIGAYWYRINTWNVTSVVLTREMEQAQSDADFHPTELLDENRITEIVNIKRSGNHPDPEPSDPEATPDPEPEIVIPEPEIPLEPAPVIPAEPEVELPEEDVPLADSPATGDSTVVWALLAAFAGIVLVGLIVTGKKRKHDEQ